MVQRLETNKNESFNPEPKCDSSEPLGMLSLSLPKVAIVKIPQNFQISFCTILKNKCHHVKELLKRFHLNGNTAGFCPQPQKLGQHAKFIAPCESTAEEVPFEWSHQRILSPDTKVRNKY